MRFRLFRLRATGCAVLLAASTLFCQTATPASDFAKAAKLYYTPTTKGLRSFHCDVDFDWHGLLVGSGSKADASDPRLSYLNSVQLSVDDDLDGSGALSWSSARAMPEGTVANIVQLRNGMEQIFQGFFQQWNSFQTGYMSTVTDNKTKVEREGAGFHVFAKEDQSIVEEHFDKNLLMLSFHVKTPALDSMLVPTFSDTGEGKVVTAIKTDYGENQAAANTLAFTIHYAPVAGFQMPSEVTVEVPKTQTFRFRLTGCKVFLKESGGSSPGQNTK